MQYSDDEKTFFKLFEIIKYTTCMNRNICIAFENILKNNNNFNINFENADGKSLLYYAINYNRVLMVRLLINHGANINLQIKLQNGYTTPLIMAFKLHHREIMNMLLNEPKIDLECSDNFGKTPIYYSLSNIKLFEKMLQFGANINAKTNLNENLLFYTDNIKIITLALKNKIDCNIINNNKVSILIGNTDHIQRRHYRTFKLLVNNLKLHIVRHHYNGYVLKYYACGNNDNIEHVKLLIKNGANINLTYENDQNLLYYVANNNIFELLLYHDCNIFKINSMSQNLLDHRLNMINVLVKEIYIDEHKLDNNMQILMTLLKFKLNTNQLTENFVDEFIENIDKFINLTNTINFVKILFEKKMINLNHKIIIDNKMLKTHNDMIKLKNNLQNKKNYLLNRTNFMNNLLEKLNTTINNYDKIIIMFG